MSEQAAGFAKQPLDDVMLAMDVVDTLRHRRQLVEHELASEDRDQQLIERLRKIYTAQGIEVSDRALQEGVTALKEDRFVYKPPKAGFSRWLAGLYVSRDRWGKWLLGGLAVLAISATAYYFTVLAPRASLPDRLETLHSQVLQVAQSDQIDDQADEIFARAQIAIRENDSHTTQQAMTELSDLRAALEQTYTLQIVNRPGQQSGVWRVPELNPSAHNYYIVVEAIGSTGEQLKVNVTNEETGQTVRTAMWAVRVDERVFKQIAADKQDDGIIQNNRFGEKRRGYLKPEYAFPTSGAVLTDW